MPKNGKEDTPFEKNEIAFQPAQETSLGFDLILTGSPCVDSTGRQLGNERRRTVIQMRCATKNNALERFYPKGDTLFFA